MANTQGHSPSTQLRLGPDDIISREFLADKETRIARLTRREHDNVHRRLGVG